MSEQSEPKARVRPPLNKKWLSPNSTKALVVDPSSFSAFTTKQLLMSLPFNIEVDIVGSVSQALKELWETNYALVVSEFDLKENTAIHLVKQMREEKFYEPAVVVLLAEQTRGNIMSVIDAEPDDLILKPYQMSFFKQRIERCFEKQKETCAIRDKLVIGDLDDAFREINDILNSHSTKASRYWCMRQKLEILRSKHQYKQVLTYADFLLNDLDLEWVRTMRIEALISQNHQELAHEAIEECIKKYPYSVNSWVMRGDLFLKQKDVVKAADSYKKALDIAPEKESALKGLSRTAESTDRYADALFAVKRLIRKVTGRQDTDESDVVNYHIAASLLVRKAESEDDENMASALRHATRYLSEAQSRYPYVSNVPTHRQFFEAYGELQSGNKQKAVDKLREITNLEGVLSQNVVLFDAIVILRLSELEDDANHLINQYVITGGSLKLLEKVDERVDKLKEKMHRNISGEVLSLRELAQQLVEHEEYEKAMQVLSFARSKETPSIDLNLQFLETSLFYIRSTKPTNELAVECKSTFETLIKDPDFNSDQKAFVVLQRQFSEEVARYRKQNKTKNNKK